MSTTLKIDDSFEWSIEYSSSNLWNVDGSVGSVKGVLAQDTFKFGGGASLPGLTFGVATDVAEQFGADWM